MRKTWKRIGAMSMAATMALGLLTANGNQTIVAADTNTDREGIQLTEDDVAALTAASSYARTSVHDPSVVTAENGDYYVFGSHMAVSKTSDLENWVSVTGESLNSSLYNVSYDDAFEQNAYTGPVTVLDADGNEYQADFGSYNVEAWIADNTIQGNQWAPDVIYNETMGKWCMYLSLNGAKWNSSIILLTADDIEGPYEYQGPVVFSGFSTADSSKSFHDTDLELVIGAQDELPEKYQYIANDKWGTYWPHAIDPCVFYDNDGQLWMSYGSWSGGIYVLELDEATGLRDYTTVYESDFDQKGASVTSDEYFGKKIAGGYYVSGEGSYIQQVGDYYYLFISYGFYSPEGGYNMRVFRSETPDGNYVDENGNSAIFTKYIMNYSNTNTSDNRGIKLMGGYKWDTMTLGEVSQGHNSAFVDEDGKVFLVYHTKFDDGTAGHEVRVHQMFVNEDGWLVVAPYEYSGETLSETGYSAEEEAGAYSLILHKFQMDYANLEIVTPVDITLNADGTVSGTASGSWTVTDGTPYVQITLDGVEYKGVFTKQVVDGSNVTTMCFTATSADGVAIWGSGEPTADAVVALNVANPVVVVPENTYTDIELASEGLYGAALTWSSDHPAILSADGTVVIPEQDTEVVLTETISKGNYYFEKQHTVTVKAAKQNATDSMVVASCFTDEQVDLSKHLDGSLHIANPFYCGTNNGLDLSGGITVEFDAESIGDVHVLGTILSFMGANGGSGRLYFTPGSYLGYNAAGSYFDANLKDYGLVNDYIGSNAHVAITITADGFTVTVNDEIAYTEEILSTENGAGTIKNYSEVLDWLYSTADTLYFGYGSWWNAAGYDEANVLISNVVFTVGPTREAEAVTTDAVSYTKDEVTLLTNADITYEENPFYGKNVDNVTLEYTINMAETTAKNGWDGIFSFYNSTTGGRISVQTAPYVCYNDGNGKWMDINQPGAGGDDVAPSMVSGTEYAVKIVITTSGVKMYVDGNEIAIAVNGSGASYSDLLEFLTECDQLTFGVGLATSAYWNTELCTLTNIAFSSEASAPAGEEEEEVIPPLEVSGDPITGMDAFIIRSNADIAVIDNPLFGKNLDALTVSYDITFAENAAKNGWDGIFSFFNSANAGRVSFQTAPYICYNDMSGNWIDINQPGAGGRDMAAETAVGDTLSVTISITKEAIVMTANGEAFEIAENGSGATYENLLAFISECDQLSFGVGLAQTAFWNTELCTVSDLKMVPVYHELVFVEEQAATCTQAGRKAYYVCEACGKMYEDAEGTVEVNAEDLVIEALGHSFTEKVKRATLFKDGLITRTCSICGEIEKEKIYRIKSVSLSDNRFFYNGETQTPAVIVKDSKGNVLEEGRDYVVNYPRNSAHPGIYFVTVRFTGNYQGTVILPYTILPKRVTPSFKDRFPVRLPEH